jgi:hypothetical protein
MSLLMKPDVKKSRRKSRLFHDLGNPKDGDLITIIWTDHRTRRQDGIDYWDYGKVFRESFEDGRERKIIHGAVVYDPQISVSGNTGELAGTLAGEWKNVEFWARWEGESREAYCERKKKIDAELERQHIPLDEIQSYVGENAIQGNWSEPKIGPGFNLVDVEGHWLRPKNGELIEVHAKDYARKYVGRYLEIADRIFFDNLRNQKRLLAHGQDKATFDDHFPYGPPVLPIEEWIRFRTLDEHGTPISDWQPGPHFDEWSRSERTKLVANTFEKNMKLFDDGKSKLRAEFKTKSDARALVEAKDMLADAENMPYDTTVDPEGRGELYREKWREFLYGEINVLEQVRNMQASSPTQIDNHIQQEVQKMNKNQNFVGGNSASTKPESDVYPSHALKSHFSDYPTKGIVREEEEIFIQDLSDEWRGHNNTPDIRFLAENGVYYFGYVRKEWLGSQPSDWGGPTLVLPEPLSNIESDNLAFTSEANRAAVHLYERHPDMKTGLPQTVCELLIRSLSIKDHRARIEEFIQLRDQYRALAAEERSSRAKQARWQFLLRTLQYFLDNFIGKLKIEDPKCAEKYIRTSTLSRPINENGIRPTIEGEPMQGQGPFHSIQELATVANLSPSGVRKILNSGSPKIHGIEVLFTRNGIRGQFSIFDSPFQKIKAKVSRKAP